MDIAIQIVVAFVILNVAGFLLSLAFVRVQRWRSRR